jgi:glycosyltransferase involved in cell wall biosynthesis
MHNKSILLVHYGLYLPAWGGAAKSHKYLIERLAEKGMNCMTLFQDRKFPRKVHFTNYGTRVEIPDYLCNSNSKELYAFELNNVTNLVVKPQSATDENNLNNFRSILSKILQEWNPDCVLLNSADKSQIILRLLINWNPMRLIIFARSTFDFPQLNFSPGLRNDPQLYSPPVKIFVSSHFMKQYLYDWGGISSSICDIPTYSELKDKEFQNFGKNTVFMINACHLKGIDTFIALSREFEYTRFVAVKGWGTSNKDLFALNQCSNIEIWEPQDEIISILENASVLLVPSICEEAFGRCVVEAMLCGIPVIASDRGGLPEAKLGVPYLIKTQKSKIKSSFLDTTGTPDFEDVYSDIRPWKRALNSLLFNEHNYKIVANTSRKAAKNYIDTLSIDPILSYVNNLGTLKEKPESLDSSYNKNIENEIINLSPYQRKLMIDKIRKESGSAK